MSIGKQFIRIGEIGGALGLWGLVLHLFSKPKLILALLALILTSIFSISLMLDDRGEIFYVNTNTLKLLDKPFGNTKLILKMNDSLTLIDEMSDEWMKVAIGVDTLFFKENFYNDSELGYTYKIQKTPFSKYKALQGRNIELNHPDGYLEAGGSMIKNGDIIKVLDYSNYKRLIRFKNAGGSFTKIPIEYFNIDWQSILKKYPKLQ
tara:strand:+ start:110 stop:727 length:618 start_codon:yes stop_codon:yes gene_type:complete